MHPLRQRVVHLAVVFTFAGVSIVGGTGSGARADIGHGHVSVLHVASADNDVPIRNVWVYRPDVRDSPTLPVVYFLHGFPGHASDLFTSGAAEVLDQMFATGTPPFVVAAPTGSGNAHPDTEWANSVDGRDLLETYLFTRVIPAVEGSNRRDAAHRIIAGFSMGGYGAANIALRHPNAFAAAASFAGYFHIDDPDHVFGGIPKIQAENNPDLMIRTIRQVRFWLADGTSDNEKLIQGQAQSFAKLAGRLVGPGDLVIAPGSHSYSFVLDHLPDLGAFVAHIVATPIAKDERPRS